jgi:hypothetical protein
LNIDDFSTYTIFVTDNNNFYIPPAGKLSEKETSYLIMCLKEYFIELLNTGYLKLASAYIGPFSFLLIVGL